MTGPPAGELTPVRSDGRIGSAGSSRGAPVLSPERRSAASSLISREAEIEQLRGFLAGDAGDPCLIVLGEPGIGKTRLWEEGIAVAGQLGYVVLAARGSEAEAALSFAALGDLVGSIERDVLAELPPPQLHALEVALRRVDPDGAPPDPLAISAGFLGAVSTLSERRRVLVAIDDLQWLDQSSAEPILFAARRLAGARVRVLLSRRPGRVSTLEKMLRPVGIEHLDLAGLSVGAISRLLADRLGLTLPRRELRQLYELSRGNPLIASELGRMLASRGAMEIGADLPVPRVVEELFGDRIRGLADPVRDVLLATALSAGLSRAELAALVDPLAVEDAIGAGLVVLDGQRMRPVHPLMAAAVRHQSPASRRREMHLGLAAAVGDPTLRARHLAMATLRPDAEVAALVDAAARIAAERGAGQEAEELAAQAFRLTARDAPERPQRVLYLARRHLSLGDMPRVRDLLLRELDTIPAGRLRAWAHILLGETGESEFETTHLQLALAEAGDDPEIRATVLHAEASLLAVGQLVRIDEAESLSREALALARAVDPELEWRMVPSLAWTLALRGRPLDEVATAVPPGAPTQVAIDRPAAVRQAFRGNLATAREMFERILADASERGEQRLVLVMTVQIGELAVRAGDVGEASRAVEELSLWRSFASVDAIHWRLQANIVSLIGDPPECERLAAQVSATDLGSVGAWNALEARRSLGIAALARQAPADAVEHLAAVREHAIGAQIDDPGAFPVAGDLVEALVQLGSLQQARLVTEHLLAAGVEQDHPWALATATRCSAMIALAQGYDAGGVAASRAAAARYAELGLDFDRGRTLLALGRAERRFKKSSAARRSLEEAADQFDRCGCSGWAQQARSELARVSGRRPTAETGLTPSERQVAELAARGLSNKEIAGRLVVSVYTVEAHLTHAYAKLGVRSRAQLARHLDRD